MAESVRTNVLGGKLLPCCFSPMTGFYRDGYCRTGPGDYGLHTVCIEVSADFLEFSRSMGNDLTTPIAEYQFPGLVPGDRWCLCVTRWKQALDAGMAPRVRLESSHISALEFVAREDLQRYALTSGD